MTTGVIVVHAPLGAAMRDCASHVMGNLDGMLAIHDIQPEDLPDDLAPAVLKDILDQELGGGVLVLTDLIGATPANIAKRGGRCPGPGHPVLRAGRPEHADAAAGADLSQSDAAAGADLSQSAAWPRRAKSAGGECRASCV